MRERETEGDEDMRLTSTNPIRGVAEMEEEAEEVVAGVVGERKRELERKLNAAEEAVLEIMRTASDTMDELENVPVCDVGRLKDLASEYVHLVEKVQMDLKDNPYLKPCEEESAEQEEEFERAVFERESATLKSLIETLRSETEGTGEVATITKKPDKQP